LLVLGWALGYLQLCHQAVLYLQGELDLDLTHAYAHVSIMFSEDESSIVDLKSVH
jgi:hypothetical protein